MLALEDRAELLALEDGSADDGYAGPPGEDETSIAHDGASESDAWMEGDGGTAHASDVEPSSSAPHPETKQDEAAPIAVKQQVFEQPTYKTSLDVDRLRALVKASKDRLRPVEGWQSFGRIYCCSMCV